MTQKEKDLLLKDLSTRLSYDVMVNCESNIYILNEIDPSCKNIDYITVRIQDVERLMCAKSVIIENIKPYLRPMSSMTEKEQSEFVEFHCVNLCPIIVSEMLTILQESKMLDWLNSHHFDFRGLIENGLAIEAPEDMYVIE